MVIYFDQKQLFNTFITQKSIIIRVYEKYLKGDELRPAIIFLLFINSQLNMESAKCH